GQTGTGQTGAGQTGTGQTYILHTNTKKFHKPDCASVGDIRTSNLSEYSGIREDIIRRGYEPCGRCKP
ncbi:MAG: MBL fold metallo-hydrolase, partial [Lachnospiraceae bacterium]|nr:MBL fold metallo-hydrolase [Lachnospiraceae bacterium]